MGQQFFVTGTDTEVGKTFVTAALLEAARAQGLQTLAMKPVAAGCEGYPEGLRNEDALVLQRHMTEALPYEEVNPVALQEAIAPHIAAQREAIELSVDQLAAHCRRMLARAADLTLIEGAGGWLVPLNAREGLNDLARHLGLPVILVVDMRLGCINHALLTAQAIAADGLRLAGWVANQARSQSMSALQENLETLMQRLHAPCLGHLRYAAGGPTLAARTLDLAPLLAG